MGMESATNVGWPHIVSVISTSKTTQCVYFNFRIYENAKQSGVSKQIKSSFAATPWPCTQAHGRDSVFFDKWPEALINNGGDTARVNPEQRSGRRWISGWCCNPGFCQFHFIKTN